MNGGGSGIRPFQRHVEVNGLLTFGVNATCAP